MVECKDRVGLHTFGVRAGPVESITGGWPAVDRFGSPWISRRSQNCRAAIRVFRSFCVGQATRTRLIRSVKSISVENVCGLRVLLLSALDISWICSVEGEIVAAWIPKACELARSTTLNLFVKFVVAMARIRFQQTLIVLLSLAAFFRVGDAGCPIASLGRRSLKQAPVPAQPALIFGFYDLTCPTLNSIIDTRMRFWVLQDIRTPGKVLRLFFHDCFAAGCEASILLNSTAEFAAEKDAPISVTLDKFQVIEDIKSEVETACPGIVSCADILALAAAKAVELVLAIATERVRGFL